MTQPDDRAPDVDQPEGGTPAEGTGTTPHPEDPAEGADTEGGADTPGRAQ